MEAACQVGEKDEDLISFMYHWSFVYHCDSSSKPVCIRSSLILVYIILLGMQSAQEQGGGSPSEHQ